MLSLDESLSCRDILYVDVLRYSFYMTSRTIYLFDVCTFTCIRFTVTYGNIIPIYHVEFILADT